MIYDYKSFYESHGRVEKSLLETIGCVTRSKGLNTKRF